MKDSTSVMYRKGYKYQLEDDFVRQTEISPLQAAPIETPYITVSSTGLLRIKRGYAWDGPSGPTIDTKSFMRGSLVHDALYQLIRMGYLSRAARLYADQLLREICREDGMWRIRAWYVYRSVRAFGKSSAMPSGGRPIQVAP